MMETTGIRILVKTVGKTRFYHIRGQDIRQQCSVQGTGEWITRTRDEWSEHVTRIAPERIVRAERDN
jgi:hypothetical protein